MHGQIGIGETWRTKQKNNFLCMPRSRGDGTLHIPPPTQFHVRSTVVAAGAHPVEIVLPLDGSIRFSGESYRLTTILHKTKHLGGSALAHDCNAQARHNSVSSLRSARDGSSRSAVRASRAAGVAAGAAPAPEGRGSSTSGNFVVGGSEGLFEQGRCCGCRCGLVFVCGCGCTVACASSSCYLATPHPAQHTSLPSAP